MFGRKPDLGHYPFLKHLKKRRVKTPTTIQIEAVECGAASLKMILDTYGLFLSLERLRYECDVTRDGSKANNIAHAARRFGLDAKGFKKELAELVDIKLPVIIFWNFNHFLVLEGFDRTKVYLNDPALGRRVLSWQEFDEGYTGVVLTFEKTPAFKQEGKKQNLWDLAKERILSSRAEIVFFFAAGFIFVILNLITPVFAKVYIDKYLLLGMDDWAKPLIFAMAVTALVHLVLNYIQQYYLNLFDLKLYAMETSRFCQKVLRLPYLFFTQRMPGEVSQRMLVAPGIASELSFSLVSFFTAALSLILFGAIMLVYNPLLGACIIAISAVGVLVANANASRLTEISQKIAVEQGKLFGACAASTESIKTIKAMGGEGSAFEVIAGYQAKLTNSMQKAVFYTQWVNIVSNFLKFFAIALVFILGGRSIIQGEMTIGMLIAFQSFMHTFMHSSDSIVSIFLKAQHIKGNIYRVDDVLKQNEDPLLLEQEKVSAKGVKRLEGAIEFKSVAFSYTSHGRNLLEDFSLSVKPGERVAFVGPSGCGKSTLLKIASGLLRPVSGAIDYDGRELGAVNHHVFAYSTGIIDQDIMIFDGSFKDNITMWNENISDSDIVAAAKDAQLHPIIMAYPQGYEAKLEAGGENLSGGQKQRVDIARALAKNPTILFMDEATSALDVVTERKIDEAIQKRGCTSLIVAHRLSTIKNADKIVVMKRGRIVQVGTHEELIGEEEGFYYALMAAET